MEKEIEATPKMPKGDRKFTEVPLAIGAEPGGAGGSSPPWNRRWPIDAIQNLGLTPPRTPKLTFDFEKFGAFALARPKLKEGAVRCVLSGCPSYYFDNIKMKRPRLSYDSREGVAE